MAISWRPAGESGWRILASPGVNPDPVVAARARRIADAVVAARVAGVREVHAGIRSVLVRFDSVEVNPDAIRAALDPVVVAAGSADRGRGKAGALRQFAMCGCAACAPDRDWIAERLGRPWPEVLSRFCAAPLEVLTIGFLPGFPYLGPLPTGFDLPRLDAPRVRVPVGSVGIGGPHAGIYSFDSPGGWRLLGRIAERIFDPARTPPARLAAGDRVQFMPTQDHGAVHAPTR